MGPSGPAQCQRRGVKIPPRTGGEGTPAKVPPPPPLSGGEALQSPTPTSSVPFYLDGGASLPSSLSTINPSACAYSARPPVSVLVQFMDAGGRWFFPAQNGSFFVRRPPPPSEHPKRRGRLVFYQSRQFFERGHTHHIGVPPG